MTPVDVPRVVAGLAAGGSAALATLGDVAIKAVRLRGADPWHCHADRDEGVFVIDGYLQIELDRRTLRLAAGDFFLVPRGTRHRGLAPAGASLLRFEPLHG
ncbi:MAG: cupin domain-containing protein [Alphaproteobacteria bacterium]|nr:cupin domain-containing protein [Alphaproteobacteria bacterium]